VLEQACLYDQSKGGPVGQFAGGMLAASGFPLQQVVKRIGMGLQFLSPEWLKDDHLTFRMSQMQEASRDIALSPNGNLTQRPARRQEREVLG